MILIFIFSFNSKLGPKLIDEDGRVDKEFEQLSSRVRKVYTAVLDGDMGKAKEELPAHYKYHEDVSLVKSFCLPKDMFFISLIFIYFFPPKKSCIYPSLLNDQLSIKEIYLKSCKTQTKNKKKEK